MVSHLLLREASSNTSLAGTDCCSGSQADFSCRTVAEFSGLQHFVLFFGQLAGSDGSEKGAYHVLVPPCPGNYNNPQASGGIRRGSRSRGLDGDISRCSGRRERLVQGPLDFHQWVASTVAFWEESELPCAGDAEMDQHRDLYCP